MRKPYLAGNWKMNLDRASATNLVKELAGAVGDRTSSDVAVFPPYVYLAEIVKLLEGSPVQVGAQNCCEQPSGAFTGEISTSMLVDLGVDSVILGHSERRHVFGETNEGINAKVHAALESGLDLILCVGETLEERESSRTESVVSSQLLSGLRGVAEGDLPRVTLAYEPVWAIGTGRTASPDQAGAVHVYLRGVLGGLYTEQVAARMRIQYGGSVKPSNIQELMSVPDVDGALVGGASLTGDNFIPIANFDQ